MITALSVFFILSLLWGSIFGYPLYPLEFAPDYPAAQRWWTAEVVIAACAIACWLLGAP